MKTEYEIRFHGAAENVRQATNAIRNFNSITPVPKEISIYKMIPISEDYFYFLLSKKGLVSKEQGEKSLIRFNSETKDISKNLIFCYKEFARKMVENYECYGACTLEAWRVKNWGVDKHPCVRINTGNKILLSNASSFPQMVVDTICVKHSVTAEINEQHT